MDLNKRFSHQITVFHDRQAPEKGYPAGYACIILTYDLQIPLPYKLSLIGEKHRRYETDHWRVFSPRYRPKENLVSHLTFALRYEGIELLLLKALFNEIEKEAIQEIVESEPFSQYSRRIWFLYEWLMQQQLPIPDLKKGNYIDLVNPKLQYPGPIEKLSRYRIRNNLPGVLNFCPMIRRTPKLDQYMEQQLSKKIESSLSNISKDVLMRAASFLLLKDSQASYAIEGESPAQSRAQRWGKAIGQAGSKVLTVEELLRLQKLVIGSDRFVKMGLRRQEGFIGEHDRSTGAPIPSHIPAKWKDLPELINGLLQTNQKLQDSNFDPVLVAAMISFGFVFIHPFVDANGRLHRYIIHHVLARMGFAKRGLVFPVSFAILDRIGQYQETLEAYSSPLLDFIQWRRTADHNVEILNDTIDFYRYFDATIQAEFLYDCVQQTVEMIIPAEVAYLQQYDQFKGVMDDRFAMPDKMVASLVRFLNQGDGRLSKKRREKEFKNLTNEEVRFIEDLYEDIFEET